VVITPTTGEKSLSFQLESWKHLRQGLFYSGLYFIGTDSPAKGPFAFEKTRVAALAFLQINISSYFVNLSQKTSAEHGSIDTEETQALLSKSRQNQSKQSKICY
jgi:hypothetical protein